MSIKRQAVAFVVCTIIATAFFLYIGLEPEHMNQTWKNFQVALATGDYPQIETLLTAEALQNTNLVEWATLFKAEALRCGDLQVAGTLWPQDTHPASFSLFVANTEYRFQLILRREATGWRIHMLPELRASAAALLYPQGMTMRLRLAERDFELPDTTYHYDEAHLGFALCEGNDLLYWQEAETRFESQLVRLVDGILYGNDADFPMAIDITLYQQKPDQSYRVLSSFSPGMFNVRLYLWQGRVVGGLLDSNWMPDRVRVLLHGDDLAEIQLQSLAILNPEAIGLQKPGSEEWLPQLSNILQISSELGAVVIHDANGIELARSAMEPLRFWAGTEALNLRFDGSAAERRIRGVLEVHPCEEGFYLVNEITLENYLRGVVSNEMPAAFGAEALKTQAIVARGYALRAVLYPGEWQRYGAHLDDSTQSQVYLLNGAESAAGDAAVSATEDEILLYRDQPAQPFFFSTSGGFTSAADDIWPIDYIHQKQRPYLRAMAQGYNLPLQREEATILDFYQRGDWQIPDRDSPWFRWQLRLDTNELQSLLLENLTQMARQKGIALQMKDRNGRFVALESPLEEGWFGELHELIPVQRTSNGQILILELRGSRNTCRVYGELPIRRLFEPSTAVRPIYHLASGSERGLELLPSAFVAWQVSPDGVVTFYGGGYGHGVGLSQHGVLGLLQKDWSVPRILQHYYPDTELSDWRTWWG